MDEKLFRKKSIDKLQSADDLNDYIRVVNPGVWILLISVLLLLAGVLIWAFFGSIDSTAPVKVEVELGSVTCFVSDDCGVEPQAGMPVKVFGDEGQINKLEKTDGGYICHIAIKSVPSDGLYDGELVYERIAPASFITN